MIAPSTQFFRELICRPPSDRVRLESSALIRPTRFEAIEFRGSILCNDPHCSLQTLLDLGNTLCGASKQLGCKFKPASVHLTDSVTPISIQHLSNVATCTTVMISAFWRRAAKFGKLSTAARRFSTEIRVEKQARFGFGKLALIVPPTLLAGWIATSEHPQASAALALHFPLRLSRDIICAGLVIEGEIRGKP